MTADGYQRPTVQNESENNNTTPGRTASDVSSAVSNSSEAGDVEMSSTMSNIKENESNNGEANQNTETAAAKSMNRERSDNASRKSTADSVASSESSPAPTAMIPFAIAKLYKLPLTSPPVFGTPSAGRKKKRTVKAGNISTSPLLKSDSADSAGAEDDDSTTSPSENGTSPESTKYVIPLDAEYTPAQMKTVVEATLPRNGAKIVKQARRHLQSDKEDRYGIIGSDGTLKRVLFVDSKNGKVYEEMQDDDDDSAYEGRFSNTIKLGLVSLGCIILFVLDESYAFLTQYLSFSVSG